jgi:hypothetical protein
MAMTPEWEELKERLKEERHKKFHNAEGHDLLRRALEIMAEIEKRTLPGRVAELCLRVNDQRLWDAWQAWVEIQKYDWSQERYQREEIAKALLTGDTSELEKWQKPAGNNDNPTM